MKVWGEDDLPGLRQWRPLEGTDVAPMLLVQPQGRAWIRAWPDDTRGGLPAMVLEVAWLEPLMLRRIAMSGITLDNVQADGNDERELLEDLSILRQTIKRTKFGLGKSAELGEVELYNGTVYDGLPPGVIVDLMPDADAG